MPGRDEICNSDVLHLSPVWCIIGDASKAQCLALRWKSSLAELVMSAPWPEHVSSEAEPTVELPRLPVGGGAFNLMSSLFVDLGMTPEPMIFGLRIDEPSSMTLELVIFRLKDDESSSVDFSQNLLTWHSKNVSVMVSMRRRKSQWSSCRNRRVGLVSDLSCRTRSVGLVMSDLCSPSSVTPSTSLFSSWLLSLGTIIRPYSKFILLPFYQILPNFVFTIFYQFNRLWLFIWLLHQ